MQFAGQRTNMELQPLGEPFNILVKLSEDVVPDPDAIMITGITPQKTIADGITEAEFLQIFTNDIATEGTIFVGYNTARFDDEFMRYLHYRNFYDAYEWQYADNKSRWDLLDVVRMTRALRPEGIAWPVEENGKPTNRLELLTRLNGISHESAHDALSDVYAVIEIAQLIKSKQPKLFDFLLKTREKHAVSQLVTAGQPFIYTSGKYDTEYEKTAVVATLANHPTRAGALVYDLRYDPEPFTKLSVKDLVAAWRKRRDDPGPRLPVKTLQYNRCPAVAPLSVLDDDSSKRLQLRRETIQQHYQKLQQSNLAPRVLEALAILDTEQHAKYAAKEEEVDARLYEAFLSNEDKSASRVVRSTTADELAQLNMTFKDERLNALLPLYKARNYPTTLHDDERLAWEQFRERKLLSGKDVSRMARYFNRLAELAAQESLTSEQRYLLEELQLYGQSIMPTELD